MKSKLSELRKSLTAFKRKNTKQEDIISQLSSDLKKSIDKQNELKNLFSKEEIEKYLEFSKKIFSLWGSKSDIEELFTEQVEERSTE